MNRLLASPLIAALLLLLMGSPLQAQQWRFFTSEDEMTGEMQAFAVSPHTTATEPLDFPYRGAEGWLGFGCDGQDEWAYIGFSEEPNLTNTETQDGYDVITTRLRWDDHVTTIELTQEWGDRFLHFRSGGMAIANMAGAKTALLELDWYGSGEVYFRFTLDGSADAIQQARDACTE